MKKNKEKHSARLLKTAVAMTLVASTVSTTMLPSSVHAVNEDDLSLSLASNKDVDVVLTLGKTKMNVASFGNDLKRKLIEKGVDAKRINISAVETNSQNLQNSFAWNQDIHSSVGSISFQNNGTKIQMRGNTSNVGFNKIYTPNNQDPEIKEQVMSFDYTINYGDSFDSAGVLLNTHVVNGLMNGYALAFPATGEVTLFKLTNWTNSASEEIYKGGHSASGSINPKAKKIGTIPMGKGGSFKIKTEKDKLIVLNRNTDAVIGTLPLEEHFGWGFGFFSDHYSHGCSDIGQFAMTNVDLNITKAKDFKEVIKEPKWRDSSKRFMINVDDYAIPDFNNSGALGQMLPRFINDEIHFIGLGNSSTKAQTESFIAKNNNNGAFYNNENYNASLESTAEYISEQLQEESKGDGQYVLVGDPINISVNPSSLATNTQTPEYPLGRWRIDHEYDYFENNLGQASWANQWQKDLQMVFDKPGKYDVAFGTKHPNPRYVYAHRRPVASFASIVKDNKTSFGITVNDFSYDLDLESRTDKGISEHEWKWKRTTDANWTDGKIPSSLPVGNDYIIQLRVKDYQGVWSAPESRYITTADLVAQPVANFTVPSTISKYENLEIVNNSYDPAGREITETQWKVTKNGVQVYTGTKPMTSFLTQGEGTYRITMKVKNTANLWSEEFSRSVVVTSDTEKPEAIVSPTNHPWTTEDIGVTVSFTDKGGSGFKQQRFAITQSPTPPTTGWSAYSSATTRAVTISTEGKNYLHIESEDNAGNKSTRTIGEYQIDRTAPDMTYTLTPSTWHNGKVTIKAIGNDSGSGVTSIKLPNGNKVYAENASYGVEANGEYVFEVEDLVGNKATKSVNVSNIDKIKPSASHTIEHVDGETYKITVVGGDELSGVKRVKLPNGQYISGGTASFIGLKNQAYIFEVEDNAGNILPYNVKVSTPELNVYQKDNHVKAEWAIEMLDDVEFGSVTKAQLLRGNKKIYEGLLSDYEDKEATDNTKPDKVVSANVSAKDGLVFMDMVKPNDNGTTYDYTVRAMNSKGDWVESERKEATVVSEIEGYSYVVDTNPGTLPDNTIDSRQENVQIPITANAKYYMHIKSIDKAGNVSDVSHLPFQDVTGPAMTITQSPTPTEWTSEEVTLNVVAKDNELEVKRIQLPDGIWMYGSTASYVVSQNGTYTFVAEDLVGNRTTKSIMVSNIDKTNPNAPTISNNQNWIKADSMNVTIQAGSDVASGVDRVEYKLEGATVGNWKTYSGVFTIRNEGETKVIARTIDNVGNYSDETVSFVRLDRSSPTNTGITIQLKK